MIEPEYQVILEKQNGVCAICKNKYEIELGVDHNHETGENRGLLCTACNVALGNFKDNIEFLEEAIRYLKLHKE